MLRYDMMNADEMNVAGMRILITSDTHNCPVRLRKVIEKIEPDELWHCGDIQGDEAVVEALDIPVRIVRGNCDMDSMLPLELVFTFGPHRIMMTHGHMYSGADEELMKQAALRRGCDTVLYGHTHVPVLKEEKGFTILNPGSLGRPRQDGHEYTFAVLTVSNKNEFLYNMCRVRNSR